MRILLFAFLIAIVWQPAAAWSQKAAPPAGEPWEADARAAMEGGAWDAAIDVLDPVLEDAPALLEARLLRAISHRENAKVMYDNLRSQYYLTQSDLRAYLDAARQFAEGQATFLERGSEYDVTRALFDFEYILARDSTHQDVLLQYARLWHDHRGFDLAISLGEAQLRARPDLAKAHVGLVRTYRNFVAWTPTQVAIRQLRDQPSEYADYFAGEVYRKHGWLEQADAIFAEMLARPMQIPRQPALLSRARIAISRAQFEVASEFIEEALLVRSLPEAKLLFEDFKYVVTPEEYAAYRLLETPEQHAAIYRTIWTKRNPTPASRINWRLVEHYRRLAVAERDYAYYGPRTWLSGPDVYHELDFPEVAYLNSAFNDKGLIFIRHGEPDENVLTMNVPPEYSVLRGEIVAKESWRYRAQNLDFHFESDLGNNWRFLPAITDCKSLEDRRGWGIHYAQLACRIGAGSGSRNEFDVVEGRMGLAADSRTFILEGLVTDRQTWPDEIESFDFPFDLVAFRGDDGTTELSLYYALPIGLFSEASAADTLSVEVGVALHDTAWTPVFEDAVILDFLSTGDAAAPSIREMRFSAPPDSYRVSIHSDLMGMHYLGGYQFQRRIPDFSGPKPMMSDAVLAFAIQPTTRREPASRGDLHIAANPFRRAPIDQPVHVYFELYNLTLDENDVVRYEVTFHIEPAEEGGLLGFLRGDEPALSVSAAFEDTTPSPIVASELDVSELDAGAYTLVVQVTDSVSGIELERRLPLELQLPDS